MTQSHVLNRSEYPELWNVVETRMPLTTEVEWQKMLTLNKTSVPFFLVVTKAQLLEHLYYWMI